MIQIDKLILKIASVALTAVVATAISVGDYYCWLYEAEITQWLSPSEIVYDSSNITEVLNASKDVAEQVGAEGITLLKNEGALPLNLGLQQEQRVNLFGVGATDVNKNGFFVFGAGSGSITAAKQSVVFPKQSLEDAGFAVNENLYNYFSERGENPKDTWWSSSSSASTLNYAKAWSDVAVVVISRFSGENVNDTAQGNDTCTNSFAYPWEASYSDADTDGRNFCQLSVREEKMIDWCSENFKKTIVVVNSGNTMEPGILATDKVDAVLYLPYTGNYAAKALGDVLAGKTNPSGHITDTIVFDSKQDPTWVNAFYNSTNGRQIAYAEDIYVGYKWYETADKEGYFTSQGKTYEQVVWRPFGYGQSYTSFKWEVEQVSKKEGDASDAVLLTGGTLSNKNTSVTLGIKVTNTGSVAGKDVVQLYVNAPYTKGGIEKPYVSLADFAKTDTLAPGASQTLTLSFNLYDISSYDCYDKNGNGSAVWELDEGTYHILLRSDAHTTADCANADFRFTLPAGGFQWTTDPVSGGEIANRFTGATAEAETPTDGSRAGNTPITYLSRADFAGTFPKVQAAPRVTGVDLTKNGTDYIDDSKYFPEAAMPTFDSKETSYYLYTREDGTTATEDDLKRYGNAQKIVPNDELVMKLGSNYNAPEWEQLLNQMSVNDIKDITARCGNESRVAVSVGKPRWVGVDGPQGINSYTFSPQPVQDVTGFPAETLVGQTWNADLARQEGAAIGGELAARGTGFIFAPAVDLHRHYYNGRNFEQYSEDPYLSGMMGAKTAYGIMTQGVCCSVKHFALSQPGSNARDYNMWLTEQNLRENYLKPFEICVKESQINHIMSSFANVGGVRCEYSHALCVDVLRNEWGFRGAIVTDAAHTSPTRTTASMVRAGNDMRFGGAEANRLELDEHNAVDMYLARQSAKNVLYMFCNTYYRAKTYNPNYTVTDIVIIPGVNWWLPTLIVLEVLALGACGYFLFVAFRRKKRNIVVSSIPEASAAPAHSESAEPPAESIEPTESPEPEQEAPPAEPAAPSEVAEPVPVAVPAPAPAESGIVKLQGEVDALRGELTKLTAAIAAQQEALDKQQRTQRERTSKAQRELNALREENAALKEELLNGQIASLNRTVAEQQAKLDRQKKSGADKPKKPSKTQRELSELREEVAELKENLKKDDE